MSGDLGFANILRYPLGSHRGIVVVRFPNEMPAAQVTQTVVATLRLSPKRRSAGISW